MANQNQNQRGQNQGGQQGGQHQGGQQQQQDGGQRQQGGEFRDDDRRVGTPSEQDRNSIDRDKDRGGQR